KVVSGLPFEPFLACFGLCGSVARKTLIGEPVEPYDTGKRLASFFPRHADRGGRPGFFAVDETSCMRFLEIYRALDGDVFGERVIGRPEPQIARYLRTH